MNHLHEWLEWEAGQSDPLPAEPMHSMIKSSMCFSMPDMDACPLVEHQPDLLRLPYPNCWIEGVLSGAPGTIVAMFGQQKADGFAVIASLRHRVDGRPTWRFFGGMGWGANSGWVYQPELRPYLGMAQEITDWLGRFLTLLNCANVSRTEHQPSAKLQKARARRGKLPLYSYWTLDLNLDRSSHRADGGGTHASPRLHLRRGHTRQHHPGRWCWVNPCAVGNKKLGVVHKEYATHRGGA